MSGTKLPEGNILLDSVCCEILCRVCDSIVKGTPVPNGDDLQTYLISSLRTRLQKKKNISLSHDETKQRLWRVRDIALHSTPELKDVWKSLDDSKKQDFNSFFGNVQQIIQKTPLGITASEIVQR